MDFSDQSECHVTDAKRSKQALIAVLLMSVFIRQEMPICSQQCLSFAVQAQ
jgi:hypothetical protein